MNILYPGSELKRFLRGTLPPLSLAVVILLPLIFGGLFTWSYLDPVGHINNLPIALVNSDEGAQGPDGKHVDAGDQVAQRIVDNDQLKVTEVSAQEARRGLEQGDYYVVIELPRDFSAATVSLNDDHPRSATMNVAMNNANGMIATVLGNQATQVLVDAVDVQVGEKIADRLLVGFSTIGEGLNRAGDGAGKLADGTHQARDGGARLDDGARKLEDGVSQADNGAHQLADGAQRLHEGTASAQDGAQSLADGLAQLQAATDRLGDGAGRVSGGVNTLVRPVNDAAAAREQALAPLINVSTMLRQAGLNAEADQVDKAVQDVRNATGGQITDQLNQLNAGAAEIARQLGDPNAPYRSGVDRAAAGAAELAAGLVRLEDGSHQLMLGSQRLADGTSQLVAGSQQLTVGTSALRSGLVDLDSGAGELSLKLNEKRGSVPNFEGDREKAAAHAAAQPVERVLVRDGLQRFGEGLGPFFFSLALFVGATTMFMVLHPTRRRVIDSGLTPARMVAAHYLPGLLVGQAQAVTVWVVLMTIIGFHPVHPVGLLVALMGASAVFVAMTQAINAALGASAGRVVCMAIMALQLVASGGLYPVETQPKFLQAIHPMDPIAHTVNIFRHMIVGSDLSQDPRVWQGIVFLACVLVISWVVSAIAAWYHRVIMHKDLHPELTI
ncbi:YhgE/Pip family protein [Corynebacterium tapiri]|uniref:YhgE/Pip domain-containing protein n=1 Tax=Corynebacterium tapiri TaxID=1448266 RepID=A0A5C4U5W0_9CORY|nr:YhgE/Pip domain-containing protein [Corynebacterium tapiri]TNL97763.1 YhgE/Pip domain-containing protein [Corynebacterium tapiri]